MTRAVVDVVGEKEDDEDEGEGEGRKTNDKREYLTLRGEKIQS